MTPRDTALKIWQAGVDAVAGDRAVQKALNDWDGPPPDRIAAVGKAAGSMTRAVLERFPETPTLVVTKDGHGSGLPACAQVIEAAHPVPDKRSLTAGRALRDWVWDMPEGSTLLLLVSGGASSLAEDLVDGHSLADLADLNRTLLASGMDIGAMNAERRKISRIKAGGLLSGFHGARADVLAISDVPGDDPMVIGSGIGALPDRPRFEARLRIVASNAIARLASADMARRLGFTVHSNEEGLHNDLEILARSIGPRLKAMPEGVLVLGGEPTVVLPDAPGRGGRNQALALALAREIEGTEDLVVVVGGTDGTDGPTDAAGAVVDGTTWGAGADSALSAANSGVYLEERGALLKTGPTGTNVMDLLIAVRG